MPVNLGLSKIMYANIRALKTNHYCFSINIMSEKQYELFVQHMTAVWARDHQRLLMITWKKGPHIHSLMVEKRFVRKVRIVGDMIVLSLDDGRNIRLTQTKDVARKVQRVMTKYDAGWFTV